VCTSGGDLSTNVLQMPLPRPLRCRLLQKREKIKIKGKKKSYVTLGEDEAMSGENRPFITHETVKVQGVGKVPTTFRGIYGVCLNLANEQPKDHNM
jgi:hypothetical protein